MTNFAMSTLPQLSSISSIKTSTSYVNSFQPVNRTQVKTYTGGVKRGKLNKRLNVSFFDLSGSKDINSFINQRTLGIEKKITINAYEDDSSIYATIDFTNMTFKSKFDIVKKMNNNAVENYLDYIIVVGD